MKDSTAKIKPQSESAEILLDVESTAAIEWGLAKVRLLWNSRRWLFKAAVIGFVLSVGLVCILPSQYRSNARLMPPEDKSNSILALLTARGGSASEGMAGLAGDLLGAKTTGALFIGILESRTVRDELISKFDLKKIYRDPRSEEARIDLANHTTISEDRKSGIITLTVTDHNPQRATAMAQEYVNELNRVVNQLSTSSAHREREFLEQRLVSVKQDLDSAEKEFSQFASQNTAIDIKEQGKAMVEAAAALQGQLIAAESQLQGLRQIYTETNVRVQSAEARIAELQRQLDKLGGIGESQAKKSVEGGSTYPSIRRLPLLGVPYADLYRNTKVQEALFEALTREYEFARVQEAKEIPSVKVLDPAVIPEEKSFPPRLLFIFLGTLIFLGCAVVWLLAHEGWREISPNDPRKLFAREVFEGLGEHWPPFWGNGAEPKKLRFLSHRRG